MENLKLGEAIRRLRKEKKKTIGEMADAIGITQSYLSRIERNLQKPSMQVVEKIADYLDVHKSYLFFDEDSLKKYSEPEKQLLARKSITIDDLKDLDIVHENGSKITEEELQLVIKYLKELRDLKERRLKDLD
ncbi:helix-turn-helix domain-containing protein [Bacillus vallismortis]|uniref:helix-turn-helix domain-containing protein n=1 Tax=Bacillus vallismortis TaxID=72361 RepID=UPI00227EAEA1|nr:helix-turn-helix transcriptional regulator [Bacillus vallismortis]MCY7891994.1 helix-turn-helix domain-containing protein [Bacillus vallismortis]